MISYNMITVYQSYEVYMDFRVGQLQYVHRPWSIIYEVNKSVLETLLSSFMLLNIRVCFCFKL